MRTRGFTLVELTVVMVIVGIIGVSLAMFFKPAIDSYFDTVRRASLADIADTALRRMSRDIRSAVPNSIRWANSSCLELLPTSTGGRYRMSPDTVNGNSAALDTSQSVSSFDVLSYMSIAPAAGDWVVVNNQSTNDVYAGVNRAAISSVTTPATTAGLTRITLSSPTYFPTGYQGGRFVVVPNNNNKPAVVYVCSGADGSVDAGGNGKGTLYRVTQAFSATYPASCPSTLGAPVVASNVKTCRMVYNASQDGSQQSALVWMQLEIAQANETVAIAYGVHVDNVP